MASVLTAVSCTSSAGALATSHSFSQAAAEARTDDQTSDGPITRVVEVEKGVSLHVVDWGGSGPVLFFVPSWSSTSHTFDRFAPRFTDAYRVLVLNVRGHGPSSRPDQGYTLERLTQDIVDVLDALEVEKATLLGLSRSESLIAQFAAHHPDRTEALIFLSGPIDREYRRLVVRDPNVRSNGAARSSADDALIELCGMSESLPWPPGSDDPGANKVGAEWRETDPSPPYASIKAPALSFWAPVTSRVLKYRVWCADAEDQMEVDRQIEKFSKASIPFFEMQAHDMAIFDQQLENGTIVVLPEADYNTFLTHPDLVEERIRSFLDSALGR